ncbi:fumarylacetoacetate hydrolase family protein [Luteibaculum oceani]|uniref:Fumarylacetoacetate hydrolase family protein n=1 Tax=Luteibaculum oceani TaxID=1294296 RepID=A0A5C6VAZ0_9FLAO|nr:fumarylacetoacetate hydrolase family protein [Luteibaculum oceani]TXC82060.1 fumarylacetoacetate hydrolase family protein [Luteibaculum oceani]
MKIICVGRNYAAHAAELKNEVPTEPVLFCKPDTALLPKSHPFVYPDFTKNLHFEGELVVKINRLGKNIDEKFAHRYYSEIGLGIDFTARDVQQKCKEKGLPWEKAKAFDYSAPVSQKFLPVGDIENTRFKIYKNGELVQDGNSSLMLFGVNKLISYISQFFTLKIGDLIFTGTPAGVGPVEIGDELVGELEGEKILQVKVY